MGPACTFLHTCTAARCHCTRAGTLLALSAGLAAWLLMRRRRRRRQHYQRRRESPAGGEGGAATGTSFSSSLELGSSQALSRPPHQPCGAGAPASSGGGSSSKALQAVGGGCSRPSGSDSRDGVVTIATTAGTPSGADAEGWFIGFGMNGCWAWARARLRAKVTCAHAGMYGR